MIIALKTLLYDLPMLEPSTLCQTKTHYTTLFLTTSKIKKINLQSFVTCLTATLRRAATESKTQVLASKLLDAVVGRSSTVIYPDGNHAWKSLAEQKGFKVGGCKPSTETIHSRTHQCETSQTSTGRNAVH